MAIYRKYFSRSSVATIAIEADTRREAQDIFDAWYSDPDSNEGFNEFLSEHENDNELWVGGYPNLEDYNRAPKLDDFLITKRKESKEPKYDLYFVFKNGVKRVFLECNMEKVVDEICKMNKDYILDPKAVPSVSCIDDARKHNSTVICFNVERRS